MDMGTEAEVSALMCDMIVEKFNHPKKDNKKIKDDSFDKLNDILKKKLEENEEYE